MVNLCPAYQNLQFSYHFDEQVLILSKYGLSVKRISLTLALHPKRPPAGSLSFFLFIFGSRTVENLVKERLVTVAF